MITQFDMATGETIRSEQSAGLPGGNPPVAPAPALRLMTVGEAALTQDTAQPVSRALLTPGNAFRTDD